MDNPAEDTADKRTDRAVKGEAAIKPQWVTSHPLKHENKLTGGNAINCQMLCARIDTFEDINICCVQNDFG